VNSLAFSPDGKRLAIAWGKPPANPIEILETATGQPGSVAPMTYFTGVPFALAFSPDGEVLAVASGGRELTLHDAATGQKRRTFSNATALTSVQFSPDGRRLATGDSGGAVKLWDVVTGQILTLGRLRLNTQVAFSPDGRRLAAFDDQGTAGLWEAATREEVAAREAQERAVLDGAVR
jgi:WD40 repeat protein